MKNPYYIDEPAVVSFSGGRTSGYMLAEILEAHGGILPNHIKVVFANTGKEMPETLDFVHQCERELSIDIAWVECKARKGIEGIGENKYIYETIVTNYENAARNGEPFESMLIARAYLPNVVARFCTKELKVKRIKDYMTSQGIDDFLNIIGIRYDEPRRAIKLHGQRSEGNECYLPLWVDGKTKNDVGDFWKSMPWDLNLPNNNGVTDWGNCDLCFLKGTGKRLAIIKARPDLADWWIRMEEESPKRSTIADSDGARFRKDSPSYEALLKIASDTDDMFGFDDESIPCFCGD